MSQLADLVDLQKELMVTHSLTPEQAAKDLAATLCCLEWDLVWEYPPVPTGMDQYMWEEQCELKAALEYFT